jgi:pimeloyl-ACP methyl ester carboxylesterase
MSDVVDTAEQYLDERGLDRPHLAGNSLGAFMAIYKLGPSSHYE